MVVGAWTRPIYLSCLVHIYGFFTRNSLHKGAVVACMEYCVDAIVSIPNYYNRGIISRFLPQYDDGSLDHADLSIMSSPHIWNFLE